MGGEIIIRRLESLRPGRFSLLLEESEASGYRFLRRVAEEWASGVNRSDRPGEALFGAEDAGRLVGVCALNVDPYADDPRIGRIRNVYVLAEYHSRGIGRRLVEEAVASAGGASTASGCAGRRAAPPGSTNRSDSGPAGRRPIAHTSWI